MAVARNQVGNLPIPNEISTIILRVSDGATVVSLVGDTHKVNGVDCATKVNSIAWSPIGDLLAIGSAGSLSLWRVTEAVAKPLFVGNLFHGSYSVAFSPKGFLAAAESNEIVIYK